MKKAELHDVLLLVKNKLATDVEAACGVFWPDQQSTTLYSVGEEDCATKYAISECDEEPPVVRYAIGD